MFNKKEYLRQYYIDNKGKILEQKKQYREKNREEINEKKKQYMRLWRKNNPEKQKEIERRDRKKYSKRIKQYYKDNPRRQLQRRYNLSPKAWEGLWYAQDGRCAICDKFFAEAKDIHVDHNHRTDEIRGLLCKMCNFGIGYFKDDSELLIKAIKYLLKNLPKKEDLYQ